MWILLVEHKFSNISAKWKQSEVAKTIFFKADDVSSIVVVILTTEKSFVRWDSG